MSGEQSLRAHVLIDSLTWGGAEALLLADLAEGARNHDLELSVGYLFAEDVAAARLNAAGLTTQPVGIGGLTDPRALPRVRRHLAEIRPDIVHTHLEYADLLGGVAALDARHPRCCDAPHRGASGNRRAIGLVPA